MTLWYDEPATRFEEALPLGNGHIGIMVYGRIEDELININETTLWGGGPTNTNPTPDAPSYLPKVRELLFKGKWTDALNVLRNIQGPNSQSFVPMGDLHIRQTGIKNTCNYKRSLDISSAIASTVFSSDSVDYSREIFVSYPANVVIMKMKSSKPGKLNISIEGNTPFEGCCNYRKCNGPRNYMGFTK